MNQLDQTVDLLDIHRYPECTNRVRNCHPELELLKLHFDALRTTCLPRMQDTTLTPKTVGKYWIVASAELAPCERLASTFLTLFWHVHEIS